jgi:hypothetical protein
VCHFTQALGQKQQTVGSLIIFIFLTVLIGRLVANVTNISSYSEHYRSHAIVHSEVNANVLNRLIFIVCQFRPLFPSLFFLRIMLNEHYLKEMYQVQVTDNIFHVLYHFFYNELFRSLKKHDSCWFELHVQCRIPPSSICISLNTG